MDASAIRKRTNEVRERVRRACERVGRSPEEITLIAVSKTFPPEAIQAALEAGLHDFGENKAQEFAQKYDVLEPKVGDAVSWHFIGHLQRNKVKLVASRAHLIHGVDSVRLARALQTHADAERTILRCLVQVNVSGESSKFGLGSGDLDLFLREAKNLDRLQFEGLMTLASPTQDAGDLREEFRRMRELLQESRSVIKSMRYLSMGMSGDFEIAIEEGATHVRIGSALFGPRRL